MSRSLIVSAVFEDDTRVNDAYVLTLNSQSMVITQSQPCVGSRSYVT